MSTEVAPRPASESVLNRAIKKFERTVIVSLVLMMVLVVTLSTVDLGWLIAKDIITPPVVLLEVDELLDIFSFFLLILIGVELLETIKAYLRDNILHVEIVIKVALIAIARKVIVLDLGKYDGIQVLGLAALITGLALSYFLMRRSRENGPILPLANRQKSPPTSGPEIPLA